ncbi:hypothetical protein RHMOL_Rhmol13G0273200 [Rhododendron molle]|uniref:Uncharacterized protein n=1 Tax=Rhododendron molle TaxID=49168 RepID=A0ACC0LB75_RHOML|nr:hypothetical protein RHMOL_Rhmol13G0273200 [Rhododendron molle]
MEVDQSFLGFEEPTTTAVLSSGGGNRLVPWLSWDEWDSVRDSLFSSSPPSVSSALRRISTWRSRGCLPVVIEVTASILEIQQKDSFFRDDLGDDASDSEEMLSMMYCMAIVRLVNGVVEKTRKKTEVSIGEAADWLNIPRMLIDIRHEGSHRDLPSLRLVRLASVKHWQEKKKKILIGKRNMMDIERREEGKITEKVNLGTTMKVKFPCFLEQTQPVLPGLNLYCKGFEVSKGGDASWVMLTLRCGGDVRHLVVMVRALDWLKSYYWEPQKTSIPSHRDGTANLRKEIKSRLFELAIGLKIKQATRSNSSLAKEKRIKHCERLCGRNKFLSLVAAKQQSSKSASFMRQITKALKHLVRLYSSYSSDVVSVLVELLLKASDSSDFSELPKDDQVSHSTDRVWSAFDDWKPVIAKLSKKEPELLLTLTKGALEMIDTQEAMKHESDNAAAVNQIERLSDLVEWLVTTLKGLKSIPRKDSSSLTERCSTDKSFPKTTLLRLLRKSLLVSSHSNTQLRNSAVLLAHMTGNSSLVQKLRKLCLVGASNPVISEESSLIVSSKSVLVSNEADSLCEAAAKLEFIKNLIRMKSRGLKTREGVSGNSNSWVVAKSWNSCPIGMLPCDIGSSGRLPVLDCDDDHKKVAKPLQSEEQRVLNEGTRKRGPDCDVAILENSNFKKMRENEEAFGLNGGDDDYTISDGGDDYTKDGVKGRLMISGVWKKVGEEELRAIASAVRILV